MAEYEQRGSGVWMAGKGGLVVRGSWQYGGPRVCELCGEEHETVVLPLTYHAATREPLCFACMSKMLAEWPMMGPEKKGA